MIWSSITLLRAESVQNPCYVQCVLLGVKNFCHPSLGEFAYEDSPPPIASGRTISQPYIVAFMIEALLLKGGEDVLEIGTGSGYAAAILAEIAKNVYSVERIGQLAEKAATTLAEQGYHNVHVRHSATLVSFASSLAIALRGKADKISSRRIAPYHYLTR